MTISFTVRKDEPLEEGSYQAVLRSMEKKQTTFGERILWLFEVPELNAEVAGFTSRSGSTQSKPYRWAKHLNSAVAGKSSWGPDDVVGKECTVVVDVYQDDKGTKNRVSEVRQ